VTETPRPAALLFDLDGTLVDSAPDLTTAVNRMLADQGGTPVQEAQVRQWIGNGARRLVARALTGDRQVDADPPGIGRAFEHFLGHYRDCLHDQTRLYPGVIEALGRLQAMGLPLGIVTNKPGAFTQPLLQAMGLADFMAVSVSGDTLPVKKPDPAPLRHAAERLGVAANHCWFVGDSRADADAAAAAGMPMIRVPWGYPGDAEAFAAHPDLPVMTFQELADQLEREPVE